jgi:hypothetical protein
VQIRDSATVGGAPAGTVDFFLYSDATCTTLVDSDLDVAGRRNRNLEVVLGDPKHLLLAGAL